VRQEPTSKEKEALPPLPRGWVATCVGDILEPSKEKADPLVLPETVYIGLEHIGKGTGSLVGEGVSTDVRSTKAVFHAGDLLYGRLRPYLNKVCIAPKDGLCSTDILVFPATTLLSSKFIAYRFLTSDFVAFASSKMSGVQHPRVSFTALSQFPLALPPLPEQHRIVAKIEELFTKLDAGVESLKRAQALLKQYKHAVLKAAVEGKLTEKWREEHKDEVEPASALVKRILKERREKWEAEHPGKKYKEPEEPHTEGLPELPEGWCWVTVAQLADVQTGATPLRGNSAYYRGGPIPWVTSAAVNTPFVDHPTELITPRAIRETNVKVFPPGTLLVAM